METEKFTLEFENLIYKVVNNSPERDAERYLSLIKGVSGSFKSGTLSAIMGPSGSCKTSFLDFITGRIPNGSKTGGVIKFRGQPRDLKTWLANHCYLEQDDYIVPKQTAYEYILFAVSCRRQDLSTRDIEIMVKETMEQLNISKVSGVVLSSLSGGERKRVMIAVEFAVGADILILDEPTSGLDSHLAFQLIHMLKTYAVERNKIVIMTIHQPGSGLFEMIDRLYFFYKGCVIYNGEVSQLTKFLDANGMMVQTSLSEPELLFELFTEFSVIKEVRDCKPQVVKLIQEKKAEAYESIKNITPTDSGLQKRFLNWGINLSHIALIYKRTATLTLRGFGLISVIASFVFILFVGFFMLGDFSMSGLTDLRLSMNISIEYPGVMGATRKLMEIIEDHAPLALPVWTKMLSMPLFASVCFLYSLFMSTNILKDTAFIYRESHKGTYSMTTLYFAVLLVELTFSFVLVTAFLILIFVSGITGVFTSPAVLLFSYGGCIFARIFLLFVEMVFQGGMFMYVLGGLLKVGPILLFPLHIILFNAKRVKGKTLKSIMSIAKYLSIMFSLNFWKE
ncbi:ATP-binding cassette, subfamily G (WHITE), member 1, partial [Pancytospora epiphaga]